MLSVKSTLAGIGTFLRALFFLDLGRRQPDWLRSRLLGRIRRELKIVSFVGGPLDGWTETVEVDVLDLTQDRLSVPISEAILQIARGEQPDYPSPVTGVAHYELQRGSIRWVYHFAGSDASQFAAATKAGRRASSRKVQASFD